MRIHPSVVRLLLLAVAAIVVGTTAVRAQAPAALPVGKTTAGQVSNRVAAVYRFTAPTAGVLTVAVHAEDDVTLTVTDEDGQALPDGASDRDLYGSGGNEQVAVTLPEGGEYRVHVALLDGSSTKFEIGAGWIAMAAFARATDPDRRPTLGAALEIGRSHEDKLDGDAGDNWDWFSITPKTSGTLTVILRSVNDDSPDLALELYTSDDLAKPSVRSDDDLQGNTTNESATVDVKAGQKVYVKVLGASGNPSGPYRLASSLIQ
jgi:hypothetical protein